MEKLGFEALAALLILLPGFVCAGLTQVLCVRPKQTELDKVVEALLYSFVVYVVFIWFFGSAVPVALQITTDNGVQRYAVELQPKPLAQLMLISIVLALAIGAIVTNDLSGRVFRALRLTQRTSRSSVWGDTFHDYAGVVLVELGDGRRVEGWIRYYSDEPSPASVFLEKAAWVTDDNQLVPIDGDGILITQELGIRTIEFLRWSEEKAEEQSKEKSDAASA